jgi:quercetin dioxygenase-like cupin family protein
MKSIGEEISRFLASFDVALRESEKEPSAIPDVEHFLALLAQSHIGELTSRPTGAGSKLPVCVHWRRAIEAAHGEPSCRMAAALDELGDHLNWVQSEHYVRSPPSANFIDNYGYAVIAGPPEIVPPLASADKIATGLILFGPQTCYPLHRHPAIEIYYVVSGHAEWWRGDGPWQEKPPGSLIYHESWIPHGMRTSDEPLIAAYLWKGDLYTDARFVE